MGGKHAAPPQEHTRRNVLLGAGAAAATAATVIATGETPRVQDPVAAPPELVEERVAAQTVGSEWDEIVSPEQVRAATTRREAVAQQRKARASRKRAAPRRAAKSKATPPLRNGQVRNARAIINTSRKYFGIPYRWGGKDPATGLDCSGYTKLVYGQHGINLPHGSRAQARRGVQVSQPQPGDLLFVRNALGVVHHVAIYVGDGYMHDAPRRGKPVGRRRVWSKPSRTFYRRVL